MGTMWKEVIVLKNEHTLAVNEIFEVIKEKVEIMQNNHGD